VLLNYRMMLDEECSYYYVVRVKIMVSIMADELKFVHRVDKELVPY